MKLQGKKVGILIESDFYEKEIFYYEHRFPEEGIELHFLSRLWGQPYLTFKGHEEHYPFECHESFEGMSDEELNSYSAIIVPSAIVSDRLRYTEDINKLAPAVQFVERAFANKNIIKGIICHGHWIISPVPHLYRGRNVTGHINLLGDIRNMGANYLDQDLVVDGDLVTARTGGHCHLLARQIIHAVRKRRENGAIMAFSHIGLSCLDPIAIERWYTKYLGFKRARVIPLGADQLVFIKSGDMYLELFKTADKRPLPAPEKDGYPFDGFRHIAFQVDNIDTVLAALGADANITLGPLDFSDFIPGWRTVWVADPEGNIVEITQGYQDQDNPPALD